MFTKIISAVAMLCALGAFADALPSSKHGTAPVLQAAEQAKHIIGKDDISSVTARLRVEGAEFKIFNLFFPDTHVSLLLSNMEQKYSADIRQIIERDLAITGGFKLMNGSGVAKKQDNEALLKQKGAEGATYLSLSFRGPLIRAAIEHKNFMTGQAFKQNFEGDTSSIRRLAHQLAHSIYTNYIGPEDIFLRQIAAIKRHNGISQVTLLDFDGLGEKTISSGITTKSAPYFSPDGKTILYTIISDQGQRIVEQEIGGKNLQERTKRAGINLDARVLPDNSGLVVTLSLGKTANIYKTTRAGEVLNKITESLGINLSPSVSPDGKLLVFVSDRSGSPQIYEQSLALGNKNLAKRLTFQGRYNQTPHYSPDGNFIAFTGRDEAKVFDVFILERSSNRISRITENQGRNQEPYFAPSGRFIFFSSEREGHSSAEIYLASLNGNHQFRLTNGGGYLTPVVRPGSIKP